MTSQERVRALLLSDVHLGCEIAYIPALCEAIEGFHTDFLGAVGDLTDRSNFDRGFLYRTRPRLISGDDDEPRWPRSHLHFFGFMSGLAKPDHHCRTIWVSGNHDDGICKFLKRMIGTSVCKLYVLKVDGVKYLLIHGDQFDEVYRRNPVVSDFLTWLYHLLLRFGPRTYGLGRLLRRRVKQYARATDVVAQEATKFAAARGIKHVICGHTHFAEYRFLNGVHYYNCGSWMALPCSFLTICEKGVRLHEFDEEGKRTKVRHWPHTDRRGALQNAGLDDEDEDDERPPE